MNESTNKGDSHERTAISRHKFCLVECLDRDFPNVTPFLVELEPSCQDVYTASIWPVRGMLHGY